jgi:hypothetical protein
LEKREPGIAFFWRRIYVYLKTIIMKQIPLTQGKFAIVDDEDYDFLIQWKWHLSNRGYARRNNYVEGVIVNPKSILMHRVILGDPIGFQVDHINGDKLDNRKSNLRVCTTGENARNRGKNKNGTSGYKGVHFYKAYRKWQSHIMHERKMVWLGYFDTAEKAALAYNEAATKLHGEFAHLNKIPE